MIKLTSEIKLEAHQVRMLDEANELATKIKALNLFIEHSPMFDKLTERNKDMMREQLYHMENYFRVLNLRIAHM